jgi:predicted dehydrogenase
MPKLLFYEMGVHWFDVWRFLFGMPDRLFAEMSRVSPYIQGEDSGIVTLGYNRYYGVMDMSWATRGELEHPATDEVLPEHIEKLVIDGEHGTLKMLGDGEVVLYTDGGDARQILLEGGPLDHEESHYRLSRHFIDRMEDGAPFATSGEDNLLTLKLVFAAYRSADEHAPIDLR